MRELEAASKDHEGKCPRLNTKMVKSFYENTPRRNRGVYKEVSGIPHGIFRDGDVEANTEKVAELLKEVIF